MVPEVGEVGIVVDVAGIGGEAASVADADAGSRIFDDDGKRFVRCTLVPVHSSWPQSDRAAQRGITAHSIPERYGVRSEIPTSIARNSRTPSLLQCFAEAFVPADGMHYTFWDRERRCSVPTETGTVGCRSHETRTF